ncbi:putative ABC transport system permease protein [Stackebrandtia albiflava]|uniref:Putative ABC transport system permease protein n=1 Tax=Stackebrandtia albiflava TaxID=406432 RepID=A0A562VCM0_9ACTN|nr:FtsX-like permease family protein [Stackebrandtia albiflava]TWJ15561.1 putative ABC transport system permease protein [Stackebrandtia albiflava]
MSAVGRVVGSGVGRRRVQTVVIGLVVLIATASVVLGTTLVVASDAPFDRAFAQQSGAHLTVQYDAAEVTEAELTATAGASGVTASAGPFPSTVAAPTIGRVNRMSMLTVVGRADPGVDVDAVTLSEGRWVTGPGEIVLTGFHADRGTGSPLGETVRFPDLPDGPTLTVVGLAESVSGTAGAWVWPDQITSLSPSGRVDAYQMLYRFGSADTTADMESGLAAVTSALPRDAVSGSVSWLTTREAASAEASLLVPFLIAFGVLGVTLAVLIVATVVTGAVGSSTRRIGVLKALGFTPAQVVWAHVAQAVIPAAVGAALGTVAGNLLTVPVLAETNRLYGTSDSGVVWWIDALAVAGSLVVVAVTALIAASRAGRMRAVDALAMGRTRRGGRGRLLAGAASRLPLPRPVTLGLAQPFARPGRAASVVAAVAFGAAAVTFAVGLSGSLGQIQAGVGLADVTVARMGPPPMEDGRPTGLDDTAVTAAITAQPGTVSHTGVARSEMSVAGLTESVEVLGFTENDSTHGYRMVSGDWISGPGEIVAATPFLTATGKAVGDSLVLDHQGTAVTVRIVGEVFNTESRGMQLLTDAATLATPEGPAPVMEYRITVAAGTDPADYSSALNPALSDLNAHASPAEQEAADFVLVINALTALLTLLLVAVVALGVLNTVVLETRDRIHDLGIHKALGMLPRQTVTMVIASVTVTGVVGGLIGLPLGVYLQRTIVSDMGVSAGYRLPDSVLDVYGTGELVLLGFGGLVIAVLGALLPAGWAARTRTAVALRTE